MIWDQPMLKVHFAPHHDSDERACGICCGGRYSCPMYELSSDTGEVTCLLCQRTEVFKNAYEKQFLQRMDGSRKREWAKHFGLLASLEEDK